MIWETFLYVTAGVYATRQNEIIGGGALKSVTKEIVMQTR